MKKAAIEKIVLSRYDGFYTVRYSSGRIHAYEGIELCPEDVRMMISNGMAETQDCFQKEVRI